MELSRRYVLFLLSSVAFPLNLSLTDYHDPQQNHILGSNIPNDSESYASDLNSDSILNILDIV